MSHLIGLLQWPAMVSTVTAAWLVASQSKSKRNVGFWIFLMGNVLWVVWGWSTNAYALISLQVCLAAMNIRGVLKNDPTQNHGKNGFAKNGNTGPSFRRKEGSLP